MILSELDATGQFTDDFLSVPAWLNDVNSGSSPPALSVASAGGGWLQLAPKAVANDYRTIATGNVFELIKGSPVSATIRMRITEAAALSSSFYLALTDTTAAGFLTTSGVPPASYNGCCLFKTAGSAALQFQTARGSVKNTLANVGTFVSGTALVLSLQFEPGLTASGGNVPAGTSRASAGSVISRVNGQSVGPTGTPLIALPLGLVAMPPLCFAVGVLASTSAAETLMLDYLIVEFSRA